MKRELNIFSIVWFCIVWMFFDASCALYPLLEGSSSAFRAENGYFNKFFHRSHVLIEIMACQHNANAPVRQIVTLNSFYPWLSLHWSRQFSCGLLCVLAYPEGTIEMFSIMSQAKVCWDEKGLREENKR